MKKQYLKKDTVLYGCGHELIFDGADIVHSTARDETFHLDGAEMCFRFDGQDMCLVSWAEGALKTKNGHNVQVDDHNGYYIERDFDEKTKNAIAIIVLRSGVVESTTLYLGSDNDTDRDFVKRAEAHFTREAKSWIEHFSEPWHIDAIEEALMDGSYEYGCREVVLVWADDIKEYISPYLPDDAKDAARELNKLISRCYDAGLAKTEENLTRHVDTLTGHIMTPKG